MPRVKSSPGKKKSASSSRGVGYLLIACLLLAGQNLFLLYRNQDKAASYLASISSGLFGSDAAGEENLSAFAGENGESDTDQSEVGEAEDKSAKSTLPPAVPGSIVKVSITNGCGATGLAGKWKNLLRQLNYDVRETDNSRDNYPLSVILCRTDNKTEGYRLAEKLGIDQKNVILQKNKNIVDIDITLVLGKDHNRLKIK